jgi:hypothetical protein
MIGNAMRAAAIVGCFIGMTTLPSLAESAFEGVWKVKDTAGQPFEIILSSGGVAKATRGEGMTGTWKEEGNAAVITWNTGWTTKIRCDYGVLLRQTPLATTTYAPRASSSSFSLMSIGVFSASVVFGWPGGSREEVPSLCCLLLVFCREESRCLAA